jgi:inositol-polyphosphate multikinase
VLKPVEKEQHGKREIDFYRRVTSSDDPVCLELKSLIPEFYGTELLTWNGSSIFPVYSKTKCNVHILEVNYIVLSNVTHGMTQPCVMDIKIGRQTWDPEATEAKKQKEMVCLSKDPMDKNLRNFFR